MCVDDTLRWQFPRNIQAYVALQEHHGSIEAGNSAWEERCARPWPQSNQPSTARKKSQAALLSFAFPSKSGPWTFTSRVRLMNCLVVLCWRMKNMLDSLSILLCLLSRYNCLWSGKLWKHRSFLRHEKNSHPISARSIFHLLEIWLWCRTVYQLSHMFCSVEKNLNFFFHV